MSRSVAKTAVLLFTLVLVCQCVAPPAEARPVNRDLLLRRINRKLGSRVDNQKRWFVLLLREQSPLQISVRYVKVQGRTQAADELLKFATMPTATLKDFAFQSFPDTEDGRADAATFHASQIAAGLNAILLAQLIGFGG